MRNKLGGSLLGLCIVTGWLGDASAAPASAKPARVLSVQDFAYARAIEAPGNSAIYTFSLPEDLYRAATRSDLGDVRVFNAAGMVVPTEISRTEPFIESLLVSSAIPFFPIEAAPAAGNNAGGNSTDQIEISQDSAGKTVRVWMGGNDAKSDERGISYLLDLRSINSQLQALVLQPQELPANKIVEVQLESSSDLKRWHTLDCSGVLAKLNYLGQEVQQDKVQCNFAATKFLRLSFPSGDRIALQGLTGELVKSQRKVAAQRWIDVSGVPDPKLPGIVLYDTAGYFPVRSFRLQLPQVNTLAQVRLLSRPTDTATWATRFRGSAYRLTTKGGELSSPAQSIDMISNDRYWRLEIQGKDSQTGVGVPVLQLGWLSDEMYFMAQGTPPFRLTYGSAAVEPPDFGLGRLSRIAPGQETYPASASLGEVEQIRGEAARVAVVEPLPIAWKKWLLWLALLGFVVVVGLMALRLAKDLKKGSL